MKKNYLYLAFSLLGLCQGVQAVESLESGKKKITIESQEEDFAQERGAAEYISGEVSDEEKANYRKYLKDLMRELFKFKKRDGMSDKDHYLCISGFQPSAHFLKRNKAKLISAITEVEVEEGGASCKQNLEDCLKKSLIILDPNLSLSEYGKIFSPIGEDEIPATKVQEGKDEIFVEVAELKKFTETNREGWEDDKKELYTPENKAELLKIFVNDCFKFNEDLKKARLKSRKNTFHNIGLEPRFLISYAANATTEDGKSCFDENPEEFMKRFAFLVNPDLTYEEIFPAEGIDKLLQEHVKPLR